MSSVDNKTTFTSVCPDCHNCTVSFVYADEPWTTDEYVCSYCGSTWLIRPLPIERADDYLDV
jgi:DNA-directed RNA polymerase subunit RPC12/RpoP